MYKYFDATFFVGNRERLRALCTEDAPIVIPANGQMQKSADTAFPFRQDSNFWYLTGVNEPSAVLVIDHKETYLIMPEMSDYQTFFDGQASKTELSSISGITEIHDEKTGWQKLARLIKKAGQVYSLTPPPDFLDIYGIYTNPTRKHVVERMQAILPELMVLEARQHLAGLRMVKQPNELKALQAAIDLTIDGLLEVRKGSYKNEQEIATALSVYFLQHGHVKHGYGPLVAAGKNTCILHYENGASVIAPHDLVLLDVGAEIEGYTADITRVVALGPPTKRQKEVHAAVCAVHDYAISLVRPGVSIRENEKEVEAEMGRQLVKLGLIKKAEREAIRHYFPHATSHFLGIDAHDLGDYDVPLAPGMVITVEPGIYIPEEGIGIRIEDDVLVTQNGCEVLSKRLPRDL